jgi:holin-like protein
MSTAPRSDRGPAVPAKGSPDLATVGRVALGLAVIVDCYLLGELAKARLGLIVPGSVLGLFLLLLLLGLRVVPLRWVEDASRLLLFVLPVSFVPIYAGAAEDRELWREWGWVILGTLGVTVALLWVFAGKLAEALFLWRDRRNAT